MDSLVDDALRWAPLESTDLDQLVELREAIDYFDDPVDQAASDTLLERYERAEAPHEDAVVGRDRGGTIVAYAWNVVQQGEKGREIWLDGGVHPAERHQHIGTHLVQWQLDRAAEWVAERHLRIGAATWVGAYVDERVSARSALMRRCGLAPERWYLDLRSDLTAADQEPAPSTVETAHGRVDLVRFDHAHHSEDVRALHNEVFTRLGSEPVAALDWERSLQRPEVLPVCSWVALARDEVVGYALNSSYASAVDELREGWTDRIGVAHSWRGQGVASALLAASKHCFAERGLTSAGVGLDTRDPEQTLGAFQRSGYQVAETVALWSGALVVDAVGGTTWVAPGHLG